MPGRLQFKGVWLGWALALISTFTFSIATPLGKAGIILGLDPTTMLVLRFGLAILLLAGSMAVTTRTGCA